jgi:ethanolamine ammonia-lyase small subunit
VKTPPVTPARWDALRSFTDARIALGRAGHSLPTAAHLGFQLAHAQARDAVHLPFDAHDVATGLQSLGLKTLLLRSAAADRATYLQRPDLGRRLDDKSRQVLADSRTATTRFDIAFVVADGLSALAVHRNAVELVAATLVRLRADSTQTWTSAPAAVVEQGRVAVGDETGEALQANVVVVLIGERPGLSSPDSLGIYITWAPKAGLTDASRNCISNVRPAGLSIEAAAAKLHQLLSQSRLRQLTGVGLKDDADDLAAVVDASGTGNFLLAPPA